MKYATKSAATALLLAPLCYFSGVQGALAKEPPHTAQTQVQAQAAAPLPSEAKPALWTLKDDDSTIYLFGTIHMLPPKIEWLTGPVKAALNRSDALVLEIIPPENPQHMAGLVGQYAALPQGKSLTGLLNAKDKIKLEETLKGFAIPTQAVDQLKPWFAATMLSLLPLQAAGFDPNQGVEMQLRARYADKGLKLEALETIEQQFKIFDSIPEAEQVRFLSESLHHMDEALPMINEMISHWLSGDADGLAVVMNESLASSPELAEAMLYNRNETWAGQLEEMLRGSGTIFVAVGAGHLAGEQSVQDYLKDRGLKVERVIY